MLKACTVVRATLSSRENTDCHKEMLDLLSGDLIEPPGTPGAHRAMHIEQNIAQNINRWYLYDAEIVVTKFK